MVSKAAQAAAQNRAASTSKKQEDAWKTASINLEKIIPIANKKIHDMESNSQIFTKDSLDVIPKFVVDELKLGRVLGKGGFGTVNEVRGITCKTTAGGAGPKGDEEHQDKKFIADQAIREGGDSRYCIKVRYCEMGSCSRVLHYYYYLFNFRCLFSMMAIAHT